MTRVFRKSAVPLALGFVLCCLSTEGTASGPRFFQAPSYESLLERADKATSLSMGLVAVAKGSPDDPIALLQQAVTMEPNRPEAYSALGFLQLYLKDAKGKRVVNDWGLIERTMKTAIDKGGEARLLMMHSHNTALTACGGLVKISRKGVAYEILKIYRNSSDDQFDVEWSGVAKIEVTGAFALVADRTLAVKIGDKTYNFWDINTRGLGIKLDGNMRRLVGELVKH